MRRHRHRARGAAVLLTAVVTAGSTAATAAADPYPVGPWVAIATQLGDAQDPAAFTAADQPQPGVSIMQARNDGASTVCTAGWAVMSVNDDVGYLTAEHCDRSEGAPLWMYTDTGGETRLPLSPLQNGERGYDDAGRHHDSAVFFLTPEQQRTGSYSTEVARNVTLRGVLSVRQIQALPTGTPICMHGSRSGITCGPLVAAREDDLEWSGGAVEGDSGAPVFVVNADGDAMAVGMLRGGPTIDDNFATYLAPVLKRLSLRAIVSDRSTAQ